MEPSSSYRPRVSRESRLLLIAGAAAITLLWVLARIRFDDRPITPNPVAPVLSQLTAVASYDTLASEIANLQGRLTSSLTAVDVGRATSAVDGAPLRVAALGYRDDVAITLLPPGGRLRASAGLDVLAADPATGLALVRLHRDTATIAPPSWAPRRTQQARFFVSSTVTPMGVSLRPTFVGSLVSIDGVAWPGAIWSVPAGTELDAGSFLFTTAGEFAGLAVASGDGVAIVPSSTVMAEAERLVSEPPRAAGAVDVEVQTLTSEVAEVTGATAGVVVTWIRRDGPAADTLAVGDVIEAVDGQSLVSREQWDARVARLRAGESLALRVRSRGETRAVTIEAAAVAADAGSGALGLEMRRRPGVGVEVTRVQPASVAARAGLSAGDVITLVGDDASPSPAQIVRAFASLRPGDRIMAAVTRGETHFVTVLGR